MQLNETMLNEIQLAVETLRHVVQLNEDRVFEDASKGELRHNMSVLIGEIAINETQTIDMQFEKNLHPCEAVFDETQLIERRTDEAPLSYEVLLGKARAIKRRAHRQRHGQASLQAHLCPVHQSAGHPPCRGPQ